MLPFIVLTIFVAIVAGILEYHYAKSRSLRKETKPDDDKKKDDVEKVVR
jgi:hypothetical protein